MKIKAKLTQTVGWNKITGNENVVVDTEIELDDISYYHNYPRQIRVDVDPNDVIKKLIDEGRLIYHSFEIEQV